MPPSLVGLLYIPNAGAGEPHAGYATRSELTFAFITSALRAGITGKTITAACLDETYRGCAIFEHCKQNGGRQYVLRQGKSARTKLKEALNAEIVEINKAHAFVLAGNKAAVLKEETIEERTQIRLIQVDGFKGWYANRPVTIGVKTISLGEYWLRHKDRRQYEGIEFAPNGGRSGHYNLWRGFAVEPREGDCSKFLKSYQRQCRRRQRSPLQLDRRLVRPDCTAGSCQNRNCALPAWQAGRRQDQSWRSIRFVARQSL